jgi:hypothetical protein
VVALGVDGRGRIYTLANDGTDRDATAVVRAFTREGIVRWERRWQPALASVSGLDLAVSTDGTIAVAARIASTDPAVPCDEIWSHGWAVKTWSSGGTPLWHRAQRGWRTCDVFGTSGRSVAIGADAVVLGIQHGDEYSASVDLAMFGVDGERRWMRRMRTPGADDEILGELALGPGGAVYAAATVFVPNLEIEHEADAVLVKRGIDGAPVWVRRVPGRVGGDERGTSLAIFNDGLVFGALMDPPAGAGVARIAAYGWGGGIRWRWRAASASETSRRSWPGPWVGTWIGGVVLAGTENTGTGHTRVTLRGFGFEGTRRWRIRLGPINASNGVHGLDTRGHVIVLAGGRYDPGERGNRIWLLTG